MALLGAQPRHGLTALALLGLLLLGACKSELFASLPEGEANEVVGVLLQAGIPASKSGTKEGASAVMVEEREFARAVALLRQHGLPRKQFQTIGEVFQQNGLVSSPMQERARFLWALGQELSSTVSQIDGVLTARVQVVLPDNDMMRRDPSPSSASVFIRHDARSQAAKLVPQIKALVAGSVEGLAYDKVSVILVSVDPAELPPAIATSAPIDALAPLLGAGAAAALGIAAYLGRHRLKVLLRQVAAKPAPVKPAE